jgi:hypothetical protein
LVAELMGIPLDMLEGPKQSLMGMMEYKVCRSITVDMLFTRNRG